MNNNAKINEDLIKVAMFMTEEPEVLKHDLRKAGIAEGFHFHTDWDWLMPVVGKCYDCQTFGSNNLIKDIKDSFQTVHIEGTYKAVINFIEWYNEN